MKKNLVIPDIHEKTDIAEHIIESVEHDHVIFLGDEFDAYDSNPNALEKTAKWLKYSLWQKNRTHLWGNHTVSYFNKNFECPEWSRKRMDIVNNILNKDDWAKFKFMTKAGDFYLSHAGISDTHVNSDIMKTFDRPHDSINNEARYGLKRGHVSAPLLVCGREAGGQADVGGVLWCRWHEFEPISGINQVVGHTYGKEVRVKEGRDSLNICLDTFLEYYAVIEKDKITWGKTAEL